MYKKVYIMYLHETIVTRQVINIAEMPSQSLKYLGYLGLHAITVFEYCLLFKKNQFSWMPIWDRREDVNERSKDIAIERLVMSINSDLLLL